MKNLDKKTLIRMAYEKPEMRSKILPLIKKMAQFRFIQDGELDGLSNADIVEMAEAKFGKAFDKVDVASIRKVNGKVRITASVQVDIGAGSNEVAEVAREYGLGILAPTGDTPEIQPTEQSVDMETVRDTPFPTRETVRNVVVVDNRTPSLSSPSSDNVSIPLPTRTRTDFRARARGLSFVDSVTRGTRHQSPTHNTMIDGVRVSITVEGNTPEEKAAYAYNKFLELKREFPDASLVTDFYIQGDTLFVIIADAQVPEDTSAIAEARSSYENYYNDSRDVEEDYSEEEEYSFDEDEDEEVYRDGISGQRQRDREEAERLRQERFEEEARIENERNQRLEREQNSGVPPQDQRSQSPAPAKGDYVMKDGSAIPNSVFVEGYLKGIEYARRDRAVQERYGFDRNGNPIPANQIYKWNHDTARGWLRRLAREPELELSKAQASTMNSTLGYKKPKSQRSGIASPHILKGVYEAVREYSDVDSRSIPSKTWFIKNFGFADGYQGQNSTEAYAHANMRQSRRASDETRAKLIRLAYEKPELRSKILPLLKEATQWANEENQMVGEWLLHDRRGNMILSKARNARDLEKLVRSAHKKKPINYDLAEEGDPDEGIDWVVFGDLWQTLSRIMGGFR